MRVDVPVARGLDIRADQNNNNNNRFTAVCPGTTRVSRYQMKHSPTHHLDHHPVFISIFLVTFTVSIARSAIRQYLVYSEADFEVFRPAGATRCADVGEMWQVPSSVPDLTPIGATTRV